MTLAFIRNTWKQGHDFCGSLYFGVSLWPFPFINETGLINDSLSSFLFLFFFLSLLHVDFRGGGTYLLAPSTHPFTHSANHTRFGQGATAVLK